VRGAVVVRRFELVAHLASGQKLHMFADRKDKVFESMATDRTLSNATCTRARDRLKESSSWHMFNVSIGGVSRMTDRHG
jgi:hypothetical protein